MGTVLLHQCTNRISTRYGKQFNNIRYEPASPYLFISIISINKNTYTATYWTGIIVHLNTKQLIK